MSDRPTPETDYEQEIDNGDTVPLLEFARRLERERDEARELARELRDALVRLRSQMMIADNDHDRMVRVFQIPTGEVRLAEAALTKAKEVLP